MTDPINTRLIFQDIVKIVAVPRHFHHTHRCRLLAYGHSKHAQKWTSAPGSNRYITPMTMNVCVHIPRPKMPFMWQDVITPLFFTSPIWIWGIPALVRRIGG
jgi:hypothetical protein